VKTISVLATAIDNSSAADAQEATEACARALDGAVITLKTAFSPKINLIDSPILQ
jgi:hypothetical protein